MASLSLSLSLSDLSLENLVQSSDSITNLRVSISIQLSTDSDYKLTANHRGRENMPARGVKRPREQLWLAEAESASTGGSDEEDEDCEEDLQAGSSLLQ